MKHICTSCRKKYDEADMVYGPDPFDSEINGNDKPVWLCDSCHYESCMDI